MIGASDFHLSERPFDQRPSLKSEVRFPRDQFPGNRILVGDWLVYYAVGGWKRVFAIVKVIDEPKRDVLSGDSEIDRRWPHAAEVLLAPEHVTDLNHAPVLASISSSLQRQIRQGVSYLEMGEPEFQRAKESLRRARAGIRH